MEGGLLQRQIQTTAQVTEEVESDVAINNIYIEGFLEEAHTNEAKVGGSHLNV